MTKGKKRRRRTTTTTTTTKQSLEPVELRLRLKRLPVIKVDE
jgi:hypothetical protein